MKNKVHSFTIVALVLMLTVCPVLIQGQTNADRVGMLRQQLEQLDELLERARDVIRSANNPIAERALFEAVRLRDAAWNDFRLRNYQGAGWRCRQAMEKAKTALAAARMAEQYEGVVQRRLERAGELLNRAKEAVTSEDRAGVRAIYESARGNMDRAWEFYRSHQYKPALKLANQIEKAAQKIIDAFRSGVREQEQFRRRNEKVEQLMERTRMVVADCGQATAGEHLERAENALRMAHELNREGRLKAALQALQRAREMAAEASRQCLNRDQLTERYEQLKREAEHLAGLLESASGAPYEAARESIRQAYDQLDLALEHMEKREEVFALASLKAAQLALRQARKHIQRH